jgi:hypothetical protein
MFLPNPALVAGASDDDDWAARWWLPSLGMNRRCRSEGIGKYGVRHCENADKIN